MSDIARFVLIIAMSDIIVQQTLVHVLGVCRSGLYFLALIFALFEILQIDRLFQIFL